MEKESGLAVETAKSVGARMVLGEPGLKMYTDASKDTNCKNKDSRVVFRYLAGDEDWAERFSSSKE